MIIGIDWDETIVQQKETMITLALEKFNKNIKFNNDNSINGLGKEKEKELFRSYYKEALIPLQYGVVEVIKQLSKNNKIKILSGRSLGKDQIIRILIVNNIPFHSVQIKGGKIHDKEKADMINESDVDVYIEDDSRVAKYIKKPLIMFRCNESINNAVHVNSWFEVEDLLTPKLFSPGPVQNIEEIKINYSHRSDNFKKLYKETEQLFRKKFNIPNTHSILFTGGSGTSAIESVISSLFKDKNVLVVNNGVFSDRSLEMCEMYAGRISVVQNVESAERKIKQKHFDYLYIVHFETSKSFLNNIHDLIKECKRKNIITVVDAISSFGWFLWDENIDVTITCSSKIIGALPVIGIVIINNNTLKYAESNIYYLSLKRIYNYSKKYQTPHTSLIPQFLSLNKVLRNLEVNELVRSINYNIITMSNLNLKKFNQIGHNGTVLTYSVSNKKRFIKLLNLLKKYNIEVYVNSSYMKNTFQISMFSYRNSNIYCWLCIVLNYIQEEIK